MPEYTKESFMEAYSELLREAGKLGLPEEFAKTIARELHSEKALRRMSGYMRSAHPTSVEQIVDEMLAISEDRQNWIRKKQAEESSQRYNQWLASDMRENEE